MKTNILFVLSLFLTFSANAQPKYSLQTNRDISYQQLEAGFENPPSESRLRCYWWWLNSMVTKESITRDLEQMKAKGYGGASLVDAGSSNYQVAAKTAAGPVFMSPEWMELYKHAVKEADRVGIELSVNVQSGWNPGAPSITPEFAMKKIVWSEIDVKGGKMISMELLQPKENLYYQDILVQAIPTKQGAPVQDEAIKNWAKKSFNKSFGSGGVFPLYELRDEFDGDGKRMAVRKNEIIDLTANFKNGKLDWNAPAGDWTIIRYGYTCTGARTSTNSDGWSGLSVDHLDPKSFDLFAKTVIIPLVEAAQSVGKSLHFLQTDSWEMGIVSWTRDFPEYFKKFRGYDIQKYMPALAGRIVEDRDQTDRFLHDFRQTVGDCVAENHYQLFYNLAHKYGLGIHPESGGPHSAPVDALKVMGISDFPQGEFWAMANTHRIKDAERLSVRQSANVAHTNGKRFVAAEGPTSIGPQWERSPMDLKGNIDRIFCSGVNRIVWHTFTSSPEEFGKPGNEYFAGTHFNPNVTWWNKANDFISYLDRNMFMLQQGLFVADVLYYYGDDVPNFVFLKSELPELKAGYDWDKCSKEVILNRVSFDGEKIVLPDEMSYRVMMLPPGKAIDLNVLRKLDQLVKQGMTLIGPKPEKATGLTGFPQSDQEIKEIADQMWGNSKDTTKTENQYGNGLVVWGKDVNQVLADLKVQPDFTFKGTHPEAALDWIHRTTNDQEIYLVENRFSQMAFNDFEYRYLKTLPDRWEQVECSFRITGKVPEFWNPVTGERTEILTYREENGHTIIPLLFEPEGSKYIVFRKAKQKPHVIEITKDAQSLFPKFSVESKTHPHIDFRRKGDEVIADIQEPGMYNVLWSDGRKDQFKAKAGDEQILLSGEWEIHFDPKWGGPEMIETDQLKSWTEFENPGVKYYSGTATYTKSFKLQESDLKEHRLVLDLGNVKEMASVKINGHQMQVIWAAPFSFDITEFAISGENKLEIEVVNMWPNRLIGDGKSPENERLTKTNINKFNGPDADQYLRVSGILGPVNINLVKEYVLKQ